MKKRRVGERAKGGSGDGFEYMPGATGAVEGLQRRLFSRWNPRQDASCMPEDSGVMTIPSYRPTEDEWMDPMEYITSITEEASKFGMAHIIPPKSWDPPFALAHGVDGVDLDAFTFRVKKQPTTKLCKREVGPGEEFGFSFLDGTYNLIEFAEHADWVKRQHFSDPEPCGQGESSEDERRAECCIPKKFEMNVPPSVEEVEKEFWRLVESPSAQETVESFYGSDLDNGLHGSGFPLPGWRQTLKGQSLPQVENCISTEELECFEKYRNHPWNVNNLSCCAKSLLHYLKDEGLISGVMIPWMYVGSCFSTFCWHIEDHALYSVNYLHLGSPKVWYSVPSDCSSDFEEAFEDALPHLTEATPTLLFQLVTQLSPKELIKRGVPVYRVVHEPRSFIITMPNAYHSGFNTGFNVAESVNFAATKWLPYGSKILKKYQKVSKPVTISQDELLYKILSRNRSNVQEDPETKCMAAYLLRSRIVELRDELKMMEHAHSMLQEFNQLTDTAECEVCKCDLWLFGCYSVENPKLLMCLRHAESLASLYGYDASTLRISNRYSFLHLEHLVASASLRPDEKK
jgi:hypothetical protein